jgi:myosin-5
MQIGMLEDTRNRTLHGILRVQSCFRGHQARCYLKELRRGIATLQSCIAFFKLYFVEIFHILLRRNLQELATITIAASTHAVVRSDKTRKEYAVLLQKHRAAVVIQKRMKAMTARKKLKNIRDASILIQSGKSLNSLVVGLNPLMHALRTTFTDNTIREMMTQQFSKN